jgi:hypothetical protein
MEINELSKISGLPNDVIHQLEAGTTDIYLNELLSIAEALGAAAIDLVEVSQADSFHERRF